MKIEAAAARRAKTHQRYFNAAGKRLPGASTIVGMKAKNLEGWANKLGLEGIEYQPYMQSLADIGTITHELIHKDLTKDRDISWLDDFPKSLLDTAQICYGKYLKWREKHEVGSIFMAETPLVSETHQYGGTMDLYADIDGIPTLVDFKTASAVYNEHWYQIAGYIGILEDQKPSYVVEQGMVVQLGKEPDKEFTSPSKTDLSREWKIFKALLEIYQLEKAK